MLYCVVTAIHWNSEQIKINLPVSEVCKQTETEALRSSGNSSAMERLKWVYSWLSIFLHINYTT
jgi:hypothetical protein